MEENTNRLGAREGGRGAPGLFGDGGTKDSRGVLGCAAGTEADGMVCGESPQRECAPSQCAGAEPTGRTATHLVKPHETPSAAPHPSPLPQEREKSFTEQEWREAEARARVCEEFRRLIAAGVHSLNTAAEAVGRSPSWFSGADSPYGRWLRDGVAGLLPQRRGARAGNRCDVRKAIEGLEWFVPAARFFYLLTNRTRWSGSVPEAVRRTISLPALPVGWKQGDRARFLRAVNHGIHGIHGKETAEVPTCPEELREAILARERNGQELVPEAIARRITVSECVVKQYRNPTDAGLDYLCAPGGLRMVRTPHPTLSPGERDELPRLALPGEVIECDDATINFPVCVPWTIGGDPCSEKFGVKVGRFQWLVSIDVGTSFIPAFTYTARPRSSYRAEDVLSLFRMVCRQHGVPRVWRLERGVWKSHLVVDAVKRMGSELETVYSPHQKPFIEGLFNTLWTKLSVHFPGSQVGRFQGEHEEGCELLTACQRGQKDPRRYFPMLSDAIGAFMEVIAEKNRTPVNAGVHGRWVPEERWARGTYQMRRLAAESEWLFSPLVREWTVKGCLVGGRVPMFEGVSVPFDFSAPWLGDYHGARVRCYFDPMEPRCNATVVLAEGLPGHKCGEVLGTAGLVNEVAGYVRLVMGWAEDPANAGRLARQQAAAALRREVRGIVPRVAADRNVRAPGKSESEARDGVAGIVRVEQDGEFPAKEPPGHDSAEVRQRAINSDLRAGRDRLLGYTGKAESAPDSMQNEECRMQSEERLRRLEEFEEENREL